MLGLSVLLIGHVYFTFLYDAFSTMRTGYVTEEYARTEHPKWLATLFAEVCTVAARAPKGAATIEGDPPSPPK